MLPIVISVSVAPVSYFFWASALPLAATLRAAATDKASARDRIEGISELPDFYSSCFAAFAAPAGLNTVRVYAATKSPSR
jgi:hypothetical protein